MEPLKDFTLIIHGPLTMYTVFTLYRHKDSFPVVIVAPRPKELVDNTILAEVQRLMQQSNNNISLFIYDDAVPSNINNEQNRYLHFFSVHLGLQSCKTPYTIKMRSDEFFSDLSPVVESVSNNKNKLITTDVFFRNSRQPFHPSDHLVAGNTQTLLESFGAAKNLCEGIEIPNSSKMIRFVADQTKQQVDGKDLRWMAAEQVLGLGAILTQLPANRLREPDTIEIMKELFHIVPAESLGLFRVMYNSAKNGPVEYINSSYFNVESDIDDIEKYT